MYRLRGFPRQANPIYYSADGRDQALGWRGTRRGHIRETNQGVIRAEPDLGLHAVLDGMGGANAGAAAARIAGEEIAASVRRVSLHPAALAPSSARARVAHRAQAGRSPVVVLRWAVRRSARGRPRPAAARHPLDARGVQLDQHAAPAPPPCRHAHRRS